VIAVTKRGMNGFLNLSDFIEKETQSKRTKKTKNEILDKISWVDDIHKLPTDLELVVEATCENIHDKREIFKQMDAELPPEIILSSTTSSLSITEISKTLKHPGRILGLHFFNPAHLMQLVEMIPTQETTQQTIQKAQRSHYHA
jgi:3-hydroxybutyryl-CoA dehydrogenase